MAVFAISFHVRQGDDYKDRYDSLVEAIKVQAESQDDIWEETTSFILLISRKNSKGLMADILEAASINADDILLVINLSEKGYTPHGVVDGALLKRLMDRRP